MKTNKYQAKADAAKVKRIESGELARIADRAIESARRLAGVAVVEIDASEMVASDSPITRHIGNQMDGCKINGRDSAKVELDEAVRRIFKIGTIGKMIHPEANAQWSRIKAVAAELKI